MSDPIFDTYLKASESWLNMQRELVREGATSSLFAAPPGAGAAPDWARDVQKKWINFAAEILNRHRESIDGLYRSAIHLFQQTAQIPETTSSDDHRRTPGANGSRAAKVTRKPSSGRSGRSRKALRH